MIIFSSSLQLYTHINMHKHALLSWERCILMDLITIVVVRQDFFWWNSWHRISLSCASLNKSSTLCPFSILDIPSIPSKKNRKINQASQCVCRQTWYWDAMCKKGTVGDENSYRIYSNISKAKKVPDTH